MYPAIQYKFDYSIWRTPPIIQITDHQKLSELSGASYTMYLMQFQCDRSPTKFTVRRRYSEFESFRKILKLVHPTLVIPPIPEKNSIGDYATKPTTAKEDPILIDKRKRMLQNFLNRVVSHPVLKRFHGFHLFISSEKNWMDIVSLLGYSALLKTRDNLSTYFDKKTPKKLGKFGIGSNVHLLTTRRFSV